MPMTTAMVVEALSGFAARSYIPAADARSYLMPSILPRDPTRMSLDCLYVCALSEALVYDEALGGCHYVCLDDCTAQPRRGFIVLQGSADLEDTFAYLCGEFTRIARWEAALHSAAASGCDYQHLVDLAEPTLANIIVVMDGSFAQLAISRNVETDEPVLSKFVENGYHSEEVLRSFREAGLFDAYSRESGIVVNAAGRLCRYETAGRWYRSRSHGVPQVSTVMICRTRELSKASIDLFEIFTDAFALCVSLHQPAHSEDYHNYDALLVDLIRGNITDPALIVGRAKCFGISSQGTFDVYRIVFQDSARLAVGRMISSLSVALPRSLVVVPDQDVIVLNRYGRESEEEQSPRNLTAIRPLLENYNAHCGVSSTFFELKDLRVASMQASCAMNMGERLLRTNNFWGLPEKGRRCYEHSRDSVIYYFADVVPYQLIELGQAFSFDLFWSDPYVRVVKQLIEHDKSHRGVYSYAQILYAWLLTERRASEAAELLCINRGTVLYHIHRIGELTGLSLEEPSTRLGLLLAFRLIELRIASEADPGVSRL
jgi:hypothetical protein